MKYKVGDYVKVTENWDRGISYHLAKVVNIHSDGYRQLAFICSVMNTGNYSHPPAKYSWVTISCLNPIELTIAELFEIKKQLGD